MTATVTTDRPTLSEYQVHLGRGWLTSERALVLCTRRNDANGYYSALGLEPGASSAAIKTAFRRLIKKIHPDLGGDVGLFQFIIQIADVLLDPLERAVYDSVSSDSVYLGNIELEELARLGLAGYDNDSKESAGRQLSTMHWACITDKGFVPGDDTDEWVEYCRQVSPAVGYRDTIRVGVVEDSHSPWKLMIVNSDTFVVFQRGVEPNRLYALCAMIELKKQLLTQITTGD